MIEFKNVSKVYDTNKNYKTTALNNINLKLKEGELVVLKGASGSGKSTILSLIAALTKPTSGDIIVDEKRISKLGESFASVYRREKIGFIFQKYNLVPALSVKENVMLPLVPDNPEVDIVVQKLENVLKKFDIDHKQNSIVRNLSGGEQQRVAIARAHINDPKIIIADEPTANLDAVLSKRFCEILQELKNSNKTIIVATHDPIFFDLEFVDRFIEIANGEILL